ncbi:hypothetical protein [Bacillus mycoides]|uniref:hypothetical protein n=1 Tax=Bacillus mycoides TaxID=1405 RepID=UPI002110F0B3|nr:hypothetical protein [Bacillus mycoides]MCQ6530825.1 hypothetical protein [Bacillus mycoides]
MEIFVLISFLVFLVISNYVVFSISKNNKKRRIGLGIIFIVIGVPITIVGVCIGMEYIGVDGIGRGVPALAAGFVTFSNGMLIIFKNN